MISLKQGERLDELNRNGYQIIQHKDKFCFGMDAVLLSGFAKVKKGELVLDMGTGTGVIPILLEAKTMGGHFTGLEIQTESAQMASRSVAWNHQQKKITIVQGDIKEASQIFGKASFHVVTCNPPYMNDAHGLKNPRLPLAIARHEVLCSLQDVVSQTAAVLKPGGRFYMVHRPRRLMEILNTLSSYGMEPKRMQMVHPFRDREANMVLIESVKGGGALMKVEPPLIVYEEPNVYSQDVLKIYET